MFVPRCSLLIFLKAESGSNMSNIEMLGGQIRRKQLRIFVLIYAKSSANH